MARVMFINPEYLAAFPDIPEGASVGRKSLARYHLGELRPPVSLPTVSIVFSDVETTEADYRAGLAGQAAAERCSRPKHRRGNSNTVSKSTAPSKDESNEGARGIHTHN